MDPTEWPSDWLSDALAEKDRFPLGSADGGFQIEIDLATPDDPDLYAELGSHWLTTMVETLGAGPVARLADLPPLPAKSLVRHQAGFGEPGSQWGQVIVSPGDRRRQGSLYAWSPRAFERLLGRLSDYPLGARVEFSQLDGYGTPGAGANYEFSVQRDYPGFKGLTRLVAYRGRTSLAGDRGAVADEWADLLSSHVRELGRPVEYAHLAVNMKFNDFRTPAETDARTFAEGVLGAGLLRSHEWITVVGTQTGGRLGDPETLRESGAFARVEVLSTDEVLLRATDRLDDYTNDVRDRIAAVVATALPRA